VGRRDIWSEVEREGGGGKRGNDGNGGRWGDDGKKDGDGKSETAVGNLRSGSRMMQAGCGVE